MKQILNDLIAEQAVVDRMLSQLTEEQWNTVAPESVWPVSIKDVVIHIAFFDYAAKALSAGEEPDIMTILGKVKRNPDSTIQDYKDMTPAEVLSWWRQIRTELCAIAYRKDPKDRVPWVAHPPMSARSIISARLHELWAHSVDITDTLGMEPVVTSDSSIDAVLFLSWQARPHQYRINNMTMPETPVYIELTMPSGKIWSKGDPTAENRIKGSAVEWALVAVRRRNWMDTELEVVGEVAREWAGIVQTYAGVADPSPKAKRQR